MEMNFIGFGDFLHFVIPEETYTVRFPLQNGTRLTVNTELTPLPCLCFHFGVVRRFAPGELALICMYIYIEFLKAEIAQSARELVDSLLMFQELSVELVWENDSGRKLSLMIKEAEN